MSNDTTQKFAHLAEQIVAASPDLPDTANLQDIGDYFTEMQRTISRGLYDAIAQTLAHVAPAFEQAGYGHVNIEWESVMSVIDILTLREGWDTA